MRYRYASSGLVVDLVQGTATGEGTDILSNVENVDGSDQADLFIGSSAINVFSGFGGADTFISGAGSDVLSGRQGGDRYEFRAGDGSDVVNDLGDGTGTDRVVFHDYTADNATIVRQNPANEAILILFGDTGDMVVLANTLNAGHSGAIEQIEWADGSVWNHADLIAAIGQHGEVEEPPVSSGGLNETGDSGSNLMEGTSYADSLSGLRGSDTLIGLEGNDTLRGGDGSDTVNGGTGDDVLFGGDSEDDLRDVIYGGAGDDALDGGYGNDELRGDAGNDTIVGGYGVDEIIGGAGNDQLTGQAWSDLILGGDGDDFINGGFGFDRVNGGAGADQFYHLGVLGHGSDWIQDYNAAEGDRLVYGGGVATADDFLIQRASTGGAGDAAVQEIFITHIPSGNLLWALVDGDAQSEINVVIGGVEYDLLV
ncbi:calcium-binding protein [Salipiger abyssi]|uniref:calcium-binding protein n=1 Tax=Salipiger abyssi TaxID=1250539 RepID=UPI000978913A|nr:calcium-binding protein [Salipiger abyssi]